MSDEIMLVFGEDGVAREYDDTWDITIHCESEEEQKVVLEKLTNSNQEAKNSTESSLTQKELDTISRQAAIDALEKIPVSEFKKTDGLLDALVSIGQVYMALKQLPSVTPQSTGKWKMISPAGVYECSACGITVLTNDIDNYKYCHGCGCEMRGVRDDQS